MSTYDVTDAGNGTLIWTGAATSADAALAHAMATDLAKFSAGLVVVKIDPAVRRAQELAWEAEYEREQRRYAAWW